VVHFASPGVADGSRQQAVEVATLPGSRWVSTGIQFSAGGTRCSWPSSKSGGQAMAPKKLQPKKKFLTQVN